MREIYILIPLVAVIGGMTMGAIAMITEHRRKQAVLEERRLMIEKGIAPPPLAGEMLAGEESAGTRPAIEASLRSGIIQIFTGVGLFCAFLVARYLVGDIGTVIPMPVIMLLGPAGAIVGLIGLGNLLYFWIASRRATGR